jgi:hypothetical protein
MMSRFGWQKTARVLHRRIVDDGRIAPASNLTEHLHEQEHLKGMTSLDAVENWTATRAVSTTPPLVSKAATINFYGFRTRTVQRLCTLPHSPTSGGGLAVSPDGRWLLYAPTE